LKEFDHALDGDYLKKPACAGNSRIHIMDSQSS
jgi:hypothetical protein